MKDVISVITSDPYRLTVRFEDGVEGSVTLNELVPFEGVFAALRDPIEFRKASVHPELGVIAWPNGADLDSDVLYSLITGASLLPRILFETR
jgi:hypothetical protein